MLFDDLVIYYYHSGAYVEVIPSEDNIRKTSVFVLLMLRAYVYVVAVLSSVMPMVMLMLMR